MIGHTTARQALERQLPSGTLLLGPASIGKWTLANHLAEHHGVSSVDRWAIPHGLSVDTVRLVAAFARRAPHGAFKLVQARIDGASHAALHALLKTLEEPPPGVKFLLTSATTPLLTVRSRCEVHELGLLNATELHEIYLTQGLAKAKAVKAAQYARGQVARGYNAESADEHRQQVIALAKAIRTSDRALFDTVFTTWDTHASDLLNTLLSEALTHRWHHFSPADAHGLDQHRPLLLRMVVSLGVLSAARPRLGVRAALEPFLSRR